MNANAKPFFTHSNDVLYTVPTVMPSFQYNPVCYSLPQSKVHYLTSGLRGISNKMVGPDYSVIKNLPTEQVCNSCYNYSYIKHDFDPYKLPKDEIEDLRKSNLYSIDVECVATGYRHCDRDVARIAIVNAMCEVIYHSYVKPELEIVSYLTPLTGITEDNIKNAPNLKTCLKEIRSILPKDAILIGQSIGHDIYWLHLEQGIDYASEIDLAKVFLYKGKSINGKHIKTSFSLRHEVVSLLGIDANWHNPETDAIYSMKLFHKCSKMELNMIRTYLFQRPRIPSFKKGMTQIDGVDLKQKGPCKDCRDKYYIDKGLPNPLYD